MPILDYIQRRIEEKKADYLSYNFTADENNAFKTFFDLAQEFNALGEFYQLSVAVPKVFFGVDARIYMIDPKTDELVLAAESSDSAWDLPPPENHTSPEQVAFYTGRESLVLKVRGKRVLMEELPFRTKDDVLGYLEVYPVRELDPHRELFFEKYANRIGFNLHNRFIAEKNIEHLRFIRSLVSDIEHNIIVPNMVYKLFLRNLNGKISKNRDIERLISEYVESGQCKDPEMGRAMLTEIMEVNHGLSTEFENLEKHYRNMSLFLETLLRRSHFDKGRLTLRTKECNMMQDVVRPQLDRYASQFRSMGINIDERSSGIPEETITVVDVGLMSQVYANLFSNALKYAREVITESGEKKKYVSYGRELVRNFFGPGEDGIKYNVFSTGPHIPPDERPRLFEDGFRGREAAGKPGTGHGLSFIKNVVELHGGIFGYEPTRYGNNFYFILPK